LRRFGEQGAAQVCDHGAVPKVERSAKISKAKETTKTRNNESTKYCKREIMRMERWV
jgi:hypothetical protein